MEDFRLNKAYALVAGKGGGKTTVGQNLAFRMAYRNKLSVIMEERGVDLDTAVDILLSTFTTHQHFVDALDVSVIVMDTLDHPSYRNGYVRITPAMIKRIEKPNFYRLFPGDGIKVTDIEAAVQEYAYNCVAVMEDAGKYVRGELTVPQRDFISDTKQKNVDALYMFHGFGQVPPDIYRYLDGMYIMRTNDTPMSCKHKIPCYGQVLDAWEKVEARKGSEKFPREYIILN